MFRTEGRDDRILIIWEPSFYFSKGSTKMNKLYIKHEVYRLDVMGKKISFQGWLSARIPMQKYA